MRRFCRSADSIQPTEILHQLHQQSHRFFFGRLVGKTRLNRNRKYVVVIVVVVNVPVVSWFSLRPYVGVNPGNC